MKKRHPITQSDAQQQAAALVDCEQFRRDIGPSPASQARHQIMGALELAYLILQRDGIRPLRGLAFTDGEIEEIRNALTQNGVDISYLA